MEDVSVIGIDLAKSVFQIHGVDARGEVVVRQRLTRRWIRFLSENVPNRTQAIVPAKGTSAGLPDVSCRKNWCRLLDSFFLK